MRHFQGFFYVDLMGVAFSYPTMEKVQKISRDDIVTVFISN